MATITVSLSGSALSGLGGTITRNITISDADLQLILNYTLATEGGNLPANPTNPQLLARWVQVYVINKITADVQNQNVTRTVPPPISMT